MLVTNPSLRANLHEVQNHPWMTRSYNGPPDPHLVHREPLRADELDSQVIRGMTGFEFGSAEEIQRRLTTILESENYLRAISNWNHHRGGMTLNGGSSTFSFDSTGGSSKEPKTPKKRFSAFGFDFYRRKLFSPNTSPPSTPSNKAASISGTSLSQNPETNSGLGLDPVRGYHPLISIYYLVREKQERERVYGPGYFASSQLSLQSHPLKVADAVESSSPPSSYIPPSAPASAPAPAPAVAFKTTTPRPATTDGPQKRADYNMPLPRLPPPESTHYSGMSYETPVIATPSPLQTTFAPQPQLRTHELPVPVPPSPITATVVTATLPRAPPASTHRRSHSLSQKPSSSSSRNWPNIPQSAGPEMPTFPDYNLNVKVSPATPLTHSPEQTEQQPFPVSDQTRHNILPVTENGEIVTPTPTTTTNGTTSSTAPASGSPPASSSQNKELPEHPHVSHTATLARRFGSLLIGSRGEHGHRSKRASILGIPSKVPSESEREKEVPKEDGPVLLEKAHTDDEAMPKPGVRSLKESHSQPLGSNHRRAATIFDPTARAARHERRSSTGAHMFIGSSIGRKAKPPGTPTTAVDMHQPRDAIPEVDEQGNIVDTASDVPKDVDTGSEKEFKPVFLKGLFRYVPKSFFLALLPDFFLLIFTHHSVLRPPRRSHHPPSNRILDVSWIGCKSNTVQPNLVSNAFIYHLLIFLVFRKHNKNDIDILVDLQMAVVPSAPKAQS